MRGQCSRRDGMKRFSIISCRHSIYTLHFVQGINMRRLQSTFFLTSCPGEAWQASGQSDCKSKLNTPAVSTLVHCRGRDGSRGGRQRCRQRWRRCRQRQRQQRAKYQKIKGILTAKRCAAAFQCKQSTRLATRAARQREKGREAGEVKRARRWSSLLCSALPWPGLPLPALPAALWAMANVRCACCGLRP